ncbi:hypothetical protein AURDEDRAFT_174344 [Auricularia subglabra TFB-10046 SS5]|nr:hypothetical protein AURDEDRAFT_174344 [Auricularia subglabra TFB-10046 SS5]
MSSPAAKPRTLLTPPETPGSNDDEGSVRGQPISSIFHPGAELDPSAPPDIVLISSDNALFYVHTQILLYGSQNAFAGLLAAPVPPSDTESSADCSAHAVPSVNVEEDASVLGLILRALYGIGIPAHSADLTQLSLVVDALLGRYCVHAEYVLSPGRPLFETILAHAAVRPLYVYSLAGSHELDALAVAASPHMLSFPMFLLSDDDARRMGPVYLRRLFFLHLGRVEALKRLLRAAVAPALHAPTVACGASQQQAAQRAWALAVAALTHDARPDMSTQTIEATLGPLLSHIWCADCRTTFKAAIDALVAGWANVKTPHGDVADPLAGAAPRVSATFHPDAALDPSTKPDAVLISADGVLFYIHSQILLYASKNAFSGLLPLAPQDKERGSELGLQLPAIRTQENEQVLSIVLHALYGLALPLYNLDLALLSLAAEELLVRYAVQPEFALSPGSPLFETILSHASVRPLHVYALAGHHELEALAVAASPHMLSFPLFLLTDADARHMGPVYLRRLFFLHLGRVEALKRLLAAPPAVHAGTPQCDGVQQQKMQRAWSLATAAIIHDARADTSTQAIEATLGPLLTHLWCTDCRKALKERIQMLLADWASVKKTI